MLTKFTALAMGVLLSVSVSAADMATLTRQAQNGDTEAQVDLAYEYYEQGNHAKAFEWYTKAANQGDADAQYTLGLMYEEGKGVRQNKSTAKRYFRQVCDQGLRVACNNYRKLNQQGY